MSTDPQGRAAVVTGGAGGIGRAVCRALVDAGARVLAVDVDPDGVRAVATELGCEHFAGDVSRLDTNYAMVDAALERFQRLDFVHLNAGVASPFGLDDSFELERYRHAMGVNLDGVVFGIHATLRGLEWVGGAGAIVATASLAGLTGVPIDPLYAANKHAVVGLTRSLGPSLAQERGVRLNAVCPGFAESRIIDGIRDVLAQTGVPIIPAERVADAVLTLFTGEMSGECWFVQAGREPAPFQFRGIPGPRYNQEGAAT